MLFMAFPDVHGDLWGPMGTYGDLWGLMRTYGDLQGHKKSKQSCGMQFTVWTEKLSHVKHVLGHDSTAHDRGVDKISSTMTRSHASLGIVLAAHCWGYVAVSLADPISTL